VPLLVQVGWGVLDFALPVVAEDVDWDDGEVWALRTD